MRAQGLRPRRGGTTLAMTTCSVLPSVPYDAVGPPNSIFLSRLNTQPTRCPVNASPLPSRTATHDSGPTWFATPWLGGTCTRETYRFVPAHREVKILMRLPDGIKLKIVTAFLPPLPRKCRFQPTRIRVDPLDNTSLTPSKSKERAARELFVVAVGLKPGDLSGNTL